LAPLVRGTVGAGRLSSGAAALYTPRGQQIDSFAAAAVGQVAVEHRRRHGS
jgi:hypothetical protein